MLFNTVLLAISKTIGALSLLLLAPAVIGKLGVPAYGVWECVTAITGSIVLFQNVIFSTLIWRISHDFGQNNIVEIRKLIFKATLVTTFFTTIVFVFAFSYSEYICRQVGVSPVWIEEVSSLLPWILGVTCVNGLSDAFLASCIAMQHSGKAMFIQSCGVVITNVVAFCCLLLDYRFGSMLIGMIIGSSLALAWSFLACWNLLHEFPFFPSFPTFRDVKGLGGFFGLVLASNSSLLLRDNFDRIYAANQFSLEDVASIGAARNIAFTLAVACGFIGLPLLAKIGYLIGKGEESSGKELTRTVGRIISIMTCYGTFLICGFHQLIYVVWLGASDPRSELYLAILVFGCASSICFNGAIVAFIKGAGRPGIETGCCLVGLALNIVLKISFIPYLGAVGAVLASSVSWAMSSLLMLIVAVRIFGFNKRILTDTTRMMFTNSLICVCAWLVGELSWFAELSRMESSIVIVLGFPIASVIFFTLLHFCGVFGRGEVDRGWKTMRSALSRNAS